MKTGLIGLCWLLLFLGTALAEDVCYDELGCFTTDYPWSDVMRPMANLPQPPAKVGTRFLLHTRNASEFEITYNGTDFGDFSPARRTMIVIHGFSDSSKTGWMGDVVNYQLQNEDCNVILVDWQRGATIPYLQATANTQLVGRQLALLAAALVRQGASVADLHLVGHSLGAHIAGYAGNHTSGPQIGRITGLDPAAPYFERTQTVVHLDSTDAAYVDNIHTDGRDTIFLGVGFKHANGHVDYFPNDGKNQPGCGDLDAEIRGIIWDLETLDLLAIGGELGCSHGRSHAIFVETLRHPDTPMLAYKCRDYAEYLGGACQRMEEGLLGIVGVEGASHNLNGSYYLQTGPDADQLCLHDYEVFLPLDEDQEETTGNLVFVLTGNNNSSAPLTGWSDHTAVPASGELHTTLHVAGAVLGPLQAVSVTYHDHHGVHQLPLRVSRLSVRTTINSKLDTSSMQLCSDGTPITNQQTAQFTVCEG